MKTFKNTVQKFLSLFFISLSLFSIFACSEQDSADALETVSAEQVRAMIQSAQASMLAAENTTVLPSTETSVPTDTDDASVSNTEPTRKFLVYWTDSGEVWHIDATCSSLKNAQNLHSGVESEAQAAGKSRVCKRCAQ